MLLYHYSKEFYPTLKTRLARVDKNLSHKEIKEAKEKAIRRNDPGSYFESISFFFDPIPLEMIGDHFQNNHHTWFNGNKLFEYTVDTDRLDNNIIFNIVETPDDMLEMSKVDWSDPATDTDEYLSKYLTEKNARKVRLGDQGNKLSQLIKRAKLYVGGTEAAYRANDKLPKEQQEYMRAMYAANVPHVMLYPKTGEIQYKISGEVVVGEQRASKSTLVKSRASETLLLW